MRLQKLLFHMLWLVWVGIAQAGVRPADLAVLVDVSGSETVDSVQRPEVAARFVPLNADLSAGVSRSVFWLRFTVPASPGEQWLEVQPPFIDDLRLYEPTLTGLREHPAGDRLPFAIREVPYRAFVFRLANSPDSSRVMYLRVANSGSALAFVRLWEPAAFQAAANAESGFFGLHFGLLIAVLLLNLIHWLWLRDPLYGVFCLHVAVSSLLNLSISGYLAMSLLVNAPEIADLLPRIMPFLAVAAAAPFYQRIMRIGHRSFYYYIYRTGMILPLLLILPVLLGANVEAIRILFLLVLVIVATGLWLGIRLARAGGFDGVLITVGLSCSLIGTGASIMTYLGWVPGDIWRMHGHQIAAIGYLLAMHVAVATRLRETHDQKAAALTRAEFAELQVEHERHVQREQAQFIAMLSHELKNPLAVIDGAAQSLSRLPGATVPEVQQRHERIRRSVAGINGLVEKFLDQDRIDDPRLKLRLEIVDARTLMDDIVAADPVGRSRLHIDMPPTLRLHGDAALLQVAVSNLIDNALKYAPGETTVEVLLANEAGGVTITVADRGPGISTPEQLTQKYIRGNHSGKVPGAGLGLYLVRRIATLHGGYLELSPRPGGGTMAQLRFPVDGVIA
jgi:signal transduction histidine kinase